METSIWLLKRKRDWKTIRGNEENGLKNQIKDGNPLGLNSNKMVRKFFYTSIMVSTGKLERVENGRKICWNFLINN